MELIGATEVATVWMIHLGLDINSKIHPHMPGIEDFHVHVHVFFFVNVFVEF